MSQVAALFGTGLEPTASSDIRVVKGMKTLSDLLAKPVWEVQRLESSAPGTQALAIRRRRSP